MTTESCYHWHSTLLKWLRVETRLWWSDDLGPWLRWPQRAAWWHGHQPHPPPCQRSTGQCLQQQCCFLTSHSQWSVEQRALCGATPPCSITKTSSDGWYPCKYHGILSRPFVRQDKDSSLHQSIWCRPLFVYSFSIVISQSSADNAFNPTEQFHNLMKSTPHLWSWWPLVPSLIWISLLVLVNQVIHKFLAVNSILIFIMFSDGWKATKSSKFSEPIFARHSTHVTTSYSANLSG